jgi:hypothetical protein
LKAHEISLQYLQASYAKDTHLVLDARLPNLLAAKEVLAKFANASGLAINWQKSEACWLASRACSTSQHSST